MTPRLTALACVFFLVLLVGCAGLLDPGDDRQATAETLTPVPVSEAASQPVTTPLQGSTASRFHALRPTCERPPALVVYIQLGALRTNNQTTNAGINTTWQFAAPSNRAAIGSYDRFVNIIREQYQPLLNAETLSLGPGSRSERTATQPVTVTTTAGERQSYVWYLEKQPEGRFEGCWMTTGVRASLDPVVPTETPTARAAIRR